MPQDWEGWSSVPALESLKPYKKYLKVLPKPFDFAPRIRGGSHGQLDFKETSQEKSINSTKLEI